jgi:hypothetical protein
VAVKSYRDSHWKIGEKPYFFKPFFSAVKESEQRSTGMTDAYFFLPTTAISIYTPPEVWIKDFNQN